MTNSNVSGKGVIFQMTLQELWNLSVENISWDAATFLPRLLEVALVVLVGFVVADILRRVSRKVFSFVERRRLKEVGLSERTAGLLSSLVFWVVVLVFVETGLQSLGFVAASRILADILDYVPNLVIAIITVVIGAILARLGREQVEVWVERSGLAYGRVLGRAAEITLVLFAVIMAASQVGIDTSLAVAIISIVLGGIVLAFSLAFGLGVKDIVGNIVASYYVRCLYKVGDRVRVGDISGEVESITKTCIVIRTEEGTVAVSNKDFLLSSVSKE